MATRTKIAAANWKMHKTAAAGHTFLQELAAESVLARLDQENRMLLFVPFITLPGALSLIDPKMLGAQNFHEAPQGAYTGEISLPMLKDLGLGSVLVGHSERRHVFGESLDQIAAKTSAALQQGWQTILCVGETLEEREAEDTEKILRQQLDTALKGVLNDPTVALSNLIVAYEPVWAIGTGKTATPEMAQSAHKTIREILNQIRIAAGDTVPVLYGGSVKPDNAAELMAEIDIDGVLVGGASLQLDSWTAIVAAVTAA